MPTGSGARGWQPGRQGQYTAIAPGSFGHTFHRSVIMLQASEIQKRFTHLQQTIDQASQACYADATLPKDLIESVDRLDKQSASAKTVMASNDQVRMRQCVDDLEQLGDRAEKACERATNINAKVKSAVSSVHAELSDLKKQLH